MSTINRVGMVKTVTVKEYSGEPRYLEVSIKAPTTLPAGRWQSSEEGSLHVDEFKVAYPLSTEVRVGDLVAFHVEIEAPFAGERFAPALEASSEDNG